MAIGEDNIEKGEDNMENGVFATAFKHIGETLKDISSLDVVTFKGSITADLTLENAKIPDSFDKVLELAKGKSEVKLSIVASTKMEIDGDILAYFDTGITDEEAMAHAELVTIGQQNRLATWEFIERIAGIGDFTKPSGK